MQGVFYHCPNPVSYTHLDVYKRQGLVAPTVQAEEYMGGYTIEGVPHSKQLDKN
ncbi:hypothetical protein A5842_002443, partial [Enterococcus faecium]